MNNCLVQIFDIFTGESLLGLSGIKEESEEIQAVKIFEGRGVTPAGNSVS
jgi:hypothetical protein